MIKATIRSLLERFLNRARFNDSTLYKFYVRIFIPRVANRRAKEGQFYKDVLGTPGVRLIFDIGANGGAKAEIFLKNADRVICVEPNPEMVTSLRKRFGHNPKVGIVASACGAIAGNAKMYIFENDSAYATLSEKWSEEVTLHRKTHTIKQEIDVPVLTLESLISQFGCPEYIKIDVEGGELDVLRGLRTLVPLTSFECNLPAFKKETLEIIDYVYLKDPNALFNFSKTEPPERFESPKWLSGSEMAELIKSEKYQFMEIFFRTSSAIQRVG